jgi:hypothetical protein
VSRECTDSIPGKMTVAFVVNSCRRMKDLVSIDGTTALDWIASAISHVVRNREPDTYLLLICKENRHDCIVVSG